MTEQISVDYSNPITVNRRKKDVNLKTEKEREELRSVLSTGAGRQVMWRFIKESGMFSTDLFVKDSHSYTNYNLGKRYLGLRLFNKIMETDQNAMMKMLLENWRDKNAT